MSGYELLIQEYWEGKSVFPLNAIEGEKCWVEEDIVPD